MKSETKAPNKQKRYQLNFCLQNEHKNVILFVLYNTSVILPCNANNNINTEGMMSVMCHNIYLFYTVWTNSSQ